MKVKISRIDPDDILWDIDGETYLQNYWDKVTFNISTAEKEQIVTQLKPFEIESNIKQSWLKTAQEENKKVILANAFSLTMITEPDYSLSVKEISEDEVKEILSKGFESAIGHESTAQLLTSKLNIQVPFNRKNVKLDRDITLIIAQLMGERKEYKDMTPDEISRYPMKYFIISINLPEKSNENLI